jgi:hypothetical protein
MARWIDACSQSSNQWWGSTGPLISAPAKHVSKTWILIGVKMVQRGVHSYYEVRPSLIQYRSYCGKCHGSVAEAVYMGCPLNLVTWKTPLSSPNRIKQSRTKIPCNPLLMKMIPYDLLYVVSIDLSLGIQRKSNLSVTYVDSRLIEYNAFK